MESMKTRLQDRKPPTPTRVALTTAIALIVASHSVLFAADEFANGRPISAETTSGEMASGVTAATVIATLNTTETFRGEWTAVLDDGIELKRGGITSTLATADLMSLTHTLAKPQMAPSMVVLLTSGSQLNVNAVRTDQDDLVIEPSRQASLRVPIKQVRSIRFRRPTASTDPVWLGMIQNTTRGDRMVIRRSGNKLDSAEGIINGISDAKVRFDLDGDEIAAPTKRLEGVIFGGTNQEPESPDILITDVYGSTWAAEKLIPSQLAGPASSASLQIQLAGNITHRIPIDLVRDIRWSGGLVMLAMTKPADLSLKTEFAIAWDDDLHRDWFGPRPASGPSEADSVSAGSKSTVAPAGNDLILHGGTAVEYRVEKDFRLFSGSVRRSETVKNASSVTVRIAMDGKVVWENSLPNADPLGFELELSDARRVRIEVDGGDDGDLGTIVRMVRPRLVQ